MSNRTTKKTTKTKTKTKTTLPPDPEQMNDERADWAAVALDMFQATTGAEDPDALADLLADLMHWCDRHDTAFEAELTRARHFYREETLAHGEER